MLEIRTTQDGILIGDRIELANGTWSRLKGLAGRTALLDGEGLLISPCQAVQLVDVAFAVDVAFLDEAWEVVATYQDMNPGTRTGVHRSARHALQLPPGTLAKAKIRTGQRLACARVH